MQCRNSERLRRLCGPIDSVVGRIFNLVRPIICLPYPPPVGHLISSTFISIPSKSNPRLQIESTYRGTRRCVNGGALNLESDQGAEDLEDSDFPSTLVIG